MAGGEAKAGDTMEITLEHTPTWIVAGVCSGIVIISLLFERMLHRLGKRLSKDRRKPLYEALLKVKEELMLLGFMSLLLNVLQGAITQRICIPESGKVPILSVEATHQLHIFIFILAVTHVVLSAITIILGITQTRNWRHWEEKIQLNDDSGIYTDTFQFH
ncbi:hypothetical protein PR202_gb08827 [Eleusine coracana subsp. coracana]|uniref:Uncharacterized protein n=1 Tax=Eleusine coracana subsp. coracana TaxID=191504 RepID=A0AAV5ED84_ELECO|nr:hypothetical protein PR202_gb08827 [Eleusine coracana subsp. coracana]